MFVHFRVILIQKQQRRHMMLQNRPAPNDLCDRTADVDMERELEAIHGTLVQHYDTLLHWRAYLEDMTHYELPEGIPEVPLERLVPHADSTGERDAYLLRLYETLTATIAGVQQIESAHASAKQLAYQVKVMNFTVTQALFIVIHARSFTVSLFHSKFTVRVFMQNYSRSYTVTPINAKIITVNFFLVAAAKRKDADGTRRRCCTCAPARRASGQRELPSHAQRRKADQEGVSIGHQHHRAVPVAARYLREQHLGVPDSAVTAGAIAVPLGCRRSPSPK